jgi:hypothetical protein
MEYDQGVIVGIRHKEGMEPDQVHTRLKAQFENDTNTLRSVKYCYQYVLIPDRFLQSH